MPFSEENRNWIREEIGKAIHPNGWKRVADWLRYWSILGVCITVFVALIGIIITLGIFVTNRVSQESEFRGTTDQRLKTIEQTLSAIQNRLGLVQAQVVAQKYAAVPPKELKAHSEELKQLKTTVAQASPSTPGYWPIVFQVIQLASQSTFADWDKIAAMEETTLSNVSSRPPGAITLAPNRRFFLQKHVEGLTIKDSIVRFDPSVELVNDVFINCVFILPVQENPSRPLQEIGKTLLASDLSKVTLNAS